MNRLTIIICSILIVATTFAQDSETADSAKTELVISLAPTLSMMAGYTNYELNVNVLDVAPGNVDVIRSVRSLLEFPLDVLTVGLTGRLQPKGDKATDWSVTAEFGLVITNPSKLMFDYDWTAVPGYFDEMFSYTESSAKMSGLTANVVATYCFAGKEGKLKTSLLAGARIQKFKYKIDNYSGWQKPFNPITYSFNPPIDGDTSGTPVLDYEVSYYMPKIGISSRLELSDRALIQADGAFLMVIARDTDDHILRSKISLGQANGKGFEGNLELSIALSKTTKFELSGGLLTLEANGSQTQEWYATTPENPIGTLYVGIPHKFTSTQYNISARIFLLTI